jgi:CheY-like chemotaxis protein
MTAGSKISHLTILVVDDEPDSIEVVEEVLTFYGACVYHAGNGEEALNLLKTVCPDLILSDLSMPEMDGWALLSAIRRNPALADVPVIALTAHAMSGDRERALAAGFNSYLGKPISALTLVSDLLARVPALGCTAEEAKP